MADRARAGIEMNFAFGKAKSPRPAPGTDAPFRMLVLGDFGAHASRGQVRPGAELRTYRVDVDTLAAVFRKIGAKVEIRLQDQPPFTIAVDDLEAFHPDRLFATQELFAPMRKLRHQLRDPKSFALAAARLGVTTPAEAAPTPSDIAAHDEDLRRLLGRSSGSIPTTAPVGSPTAIVDALIREAIAPHIVGKPDPRQADLVAAVDGMTGELMRALLHHPALQSLEATWRGLDRLVRSLELDETLQVWVLDASREELVEDLAGTPTVAESAMHRLIAAQGADEPWSLLVDLTPYRRGEQDAALLLRLGAIAQEGDAAVLAGLDWAAWSEGFASPEAQQAWTALRNTPTATSIAVASPSILLRLPYGKDTDPADGFAFAEQTIPPASGRYLWGSAAGAVAQLLAQSFAGAGGWDFAPGDASSINDLPIHVSKNQDESVQTPCAQAWLPESTIDALIKEGLMPLVSARGRGEVRVPRFQSLAHPPAPLAGRWRSE